MKIVDLQESFDSSYEIKWETKNNNEWYGIFDADGIKYSISIDGSMSNGWEDPNNPNEVGKWWELGFSLESDGFSGSKVIGTDGKELKIFSTVLNGFDEFLKEVKPKLVFLHASKENSNRYRVYKAIYKKFENKMKNMGYEIIDNPKNIYYDEVNKDDSYDAISWKKS